MTKLTEHRVRMAYLFSFIWGPRNKLRTIFGKFYERNKYQNNKIKEPESDLQLKLF